MNYLIDEAVDTGKRANNIISMIHHFLTTHNLGEANLHLHVDKCSGQNKNRYVMQYVRLVWCEQIHHSLIPDRRTHQIFSGLVFRSFQTGVSED